MRVLVETLDNSVSHSCACTCSAITIVCACFGSVLYVRASGGFSLSKTSRAISDRVRVWKILVLLKNIGIV